MHQNYYGNNLFSPENFKYVEINKQPAATCDNFLNGVLNAKNILCSLERSLKKTQNYEDQLLKCQCKHFHTTNEQYVFSNKNDTSEEKCASSRSSEDLANDWASMNVVCLKYQYEELSARYDVLLREYDERCNLETSHKETISRLRNRMKRNHTNLIEANKALLAVGEKYMKLRQKKLIEKEWFEHRIEQLKQRIEDVVRTAERARLELDDQLNNCHEDNVSLSLLVEEVLLRLYYSEEDTKQMKIPAPSSEAVRPFASGELSSIDGRLDEDVFVNFTMSDSSSEDDYINMVRKCNLSFLENIQMKSNVYE